MLEDGSIVDLNLARSTLLSKRGVQRPFVHANVEVPADLLAFIERGTEGLKSAEEALFLVHDGVTEGPNGEKLLFKDGEVKKCAPLPSLASRLAMAGANFYDHAADAYSKIRGEKITREDIRRQVEEGKSPPWGFWKHPRNVVGPDEPIIYPARTERLDYEVEVAAIFGKKGKDIPEEEAMSYIYGYTIVNDVSCRDQPSDSGLFLAKNFDTSAPMGPCIVTADEVGDPHELRLKLKIDGRIRQNGSQRDMIRDYPFWISFLTPGHDFLSRRHNMRRDVLRDCAGLNPERARRGDGPGPVPQARSGDRGLGGEDRHPPQPDRRQGINPLFILYHISNW